MRHATTPAPSGRAEVDQLFARMSTVVRVIGLGRSTIYRLIAEDKFPAQVRIGARAVAWRWKDLERCGAEHPTIAH
jgi:prophage regulatory protein